MDDFNQLVKNCETYGKNSKYREVLIYANGKTHYTDIAKKVGLHHTKVSSALSLAEKLGLANKNKKGFYKKRTGVLTHVPRDIAKTQPGSKTNVIARVSKGTKKASKTKGAIVSARISNSANKMLDAYNRLYFTENTLRELIRKVMISETNWWKTRVPKDVKDSVAEGMSKMPYHAARRQDELEHTHLGDLSKIITSNWKLFQPFMDENDKMKFATMVNHAIPSRNAIGHCIPLTDEDSRRVEVRFHDILTMIK